MAVGLGVAGFGFLLEQSYRNGELRDLKEYNDILKAQNRELGESLQSVNDVNTQMSVEFKKMNFELTLLVHQLSQSWRQQDALHADFRNSYCFWPSQAYRKNVSDQKISSGLKKGI